jgi:hypothetical protein
LKPKNYPKIQSQKVAGAVSGFFLLSIIHGLSHQPYLFVDSNLLDQGAKDLPVASVAKPATSTVPTVPQVPQATWMAWAVHPSLRHADAEIGVNIELDHGTI